MSKKRKREKRALKIAGIPPRDPAVAGFFTGYGQESHAGVEVTETTAFNCAAIWAGVSVIAGAFAVLPGGQYEKGIDSAALIDDDSQTVRMIRDEPNPEMTPAVFKETLQAHVLLAGNAYAEVERTNDGQPLYLWPLPPRTTKPVRDSQGRLWYEEGSGGGKPRMIPAEDVLHVPGLGYDGLVGYSVVHMARESFGLAMGAERYGAALFGHGAKPGGVLQTDKPLSPEAIQNLRQSWNEIHQGIDRAHRVAILQAGLKWQPVAFSPGEAQFLDTRKFQIEEVARWFDLPPHMLRHLDVATGQRNIEHQSLEFVQYTLAKWCTKWEQELNRKLLLPNQRARRFFKFNTEILLRGDMLSRYRAYAIARQHGWMNADAVLRAEGQNPLPDGKGQVFLVPTNYQSVDHLLKMEEKLQNAPVGAAPPRVGPGNQAGGVKDGRPDGGGDD